MLTFNANFTKAFDGRPCTPIWKLVLSRDTYTRTWVSGGSPLFGYAASISGVSSIGESIDPVTRKGSTSGVSIDFADDGELRDAMDYFGSHGLPFAGTKAQLYLGTPELDESDFECLFGGYVRNLDPRDGRMTLSLDDWRSLYLGRSQTYSFEGVNPYEILQTLIGAVGSGTVTTPADRTHWLTTITSEDGADWSTAQADKVQAGEMFAWGLDELVSVLLGTLRYKPSTDAIEFVSYDASATPVRVLTTDDVTDVAQKELAGYLFNRVVAPLGVSFFRGTAAPNLHGGGGFLSWGSGTPPIPQGTAIAPPVEVRQQFYIEDGDALLRAARESEYQLNARLFKNIARVVGANGVFAGFAGAGDISVSNATGQTLILESPIRLGITGSHSPKYTMAELRDVGGALDEPCDSTHLAYFMLITGADAWGGTDENNIANEVEFVSANVSAVRQMPLGFAADADASIPPPFAVTTSTVWTPKHVEYTLNGRGLFGTTAQSFYVNASGAKTWIVDVTAIVACLQTINFRFRDGVGVVECLAHQRNMDLELGDFVRLAHPVPSILGQSTLDENAIFEVIRTDRAVFDTTPGVRLTLAYVRSDSFSLTPAPQYGLRGPPLFKIDRGSGAILQRTLGGQRFMRNL